jgi:hypothetical protein
MGREQKILAAKPALRAVMSSAQGMAPPKPMRAASAIKRADKARQS